MKAVCIKHTGNHLIAISETTLSIYEVTDISHLENGKYKYSLTNPNNHTHVMSEEYFNKHFRIIVEL
jgi:hypothetical protein